MATKSEATPASGLALSRSVLKSLETLKCELIREHLLPLKRAYDDNLRNIPRTDPNPMVYIARQTELYRNNQKACKDRIAVQLQQQLHSILAEAVIEVETWPTLDHDPASSTTSDTDEGQKRAETSDNEPVPDHHRVCDGAEASTSREGIFNGAAGSSRPREQEDSLFVSMSPMETPPVRGNVENPILRLRASESGDKAPVAANAHDGEKSGHTRPSEVQPPTDLARSRNTPVKPADQHVEPAAPTDNLASGVKRPRVSMKDFFTPSKPATKKIKTTPIIGPSPRSTVPKPYLATKKTITMAEVNPDECVHRYNGHKGFYVLRCNAMACKKKVESLEPTPRDLTSVKMAAQLVVYFTANPMEIAGNPMGSSNAIGHFRGKGHGIRDMSDVYEKYAIRVTDATEEQNTEKPINKNSCLKVGPCNGKKVIVSDSILDRVQAADASNPMTAPQPEMPNSTSLKVGASTQKSPTSNQSDKQPTIEPSIQRSNIVNELLSAQQERSWKAPGIAAASTAASNNPITIQESEEEAGSVSRSKMNRFEAHVSKGKNTVQIIGDGATAQGDKVSKPTVPSPSPSRPKKGKSREVDTAASSDSDDSDDSIPALTAVARRMSRMSKLTSRIV